MYIRLRGHFLLLCLVFILLSCIGAYAQPQTALKKLSTTGSRYTVQNNTSCEESYFIKGFTNPKQTALPIDMVTTSEDDVIICGEIRNDPPNYNDGFIFRVNELGNKLWELSFGGQASQAVLKLAKLKDNHFIAAGYDSNSEGKVTYFLIKFDLNGKVMWRKDIHFSTNETMGIRKIMEDADGSLVMTAYLLENTLSFQDRLLYFKFDASGNLQYTNNFKPKDPTSVLYTNDAIIKEGYTYVVGTHLHNPSNLIKGFLTKIDNASGNQLWTKVYDFNGREESFLQVFDYGNGRIVILGQNDLNASDTSTVMICDTSGKIVSYKYFESGPHLQFGRGAIDKDGNLMYANSYRISGNPVLSFVNVHPITGKRWGHHYSKFDFQPSVSKLGYTANNILYAMGGLDWGRVMVARLDAQGKSGCDITAFTLNVGDAESTPISSLFLVSSRSFINSSRNQPSEVDVLKEDQLLCEVTNSCTVLDITGDSKVCRLTDTLVLNIDRNKECLSQPDLRYDGNYFSLIDFTANRARFKVKQAGRSVIGVLLKTACFTLADEIEINIHDAPATVYLGKDSSICPANTLLLNARKGFQSYLWQDGSTDSTFIVTVPGIFHVQTVDGCGKTFKDTIVIKAFAPIPFDVGPDRSKCNQDTVHLTAPANFMNYSWKKSDGNYVENTVSIVVNPDITTSYYVQAEKTLGCYAYDTVQVTVNHSPLIDLGKDTSLCAGDSLVLNAGASFNRYQWETQVGGHVSPSIIARTKGAYSVQAWNDKGCLTKDTLWIREVFPLPAIKLDKNTTLCEGSTRILSAGAGYVMYQWSTGATTPTIAVNSIGEYRVRVQDKNGCAAKDSVHISKTLPLPSNFLPASAQICSYETLLVKPQVAFSKYLWSTGGTAPQIPISNGGKYWLEATDANNCVGRDTIQVILKTDCISGFHVPTAFTPNKDGKNDVFRPLVFGNVKKYQFAVYNRWGEVVFQSSEIGKGWDGKLLGRPQDTNVFVWTCAYQLEGGELQSEKGTVTLIR